MYNTEIKKSKFNDFSAKDSGISFSIFSLVFLALSFILSICATIILTIILKDQTQVIDAVSSDLCSVILTVIVQICFVITAMLIAKYSKVNFFKATKLTKKPDLKTMFICVAFSFGIVFALLPLSNLFMSLLEKIGYTSGAGIYANTVGKYIFYIFAVCALPAVCEEIMFRGVILQGLRKHGDIFAIFISAFLFSIFHQNPSQTIHQFLVGVIWGVLVIKTGSIWVSVILHFLNNFIAITFDFILSMTGTAGVSNVVYWILFAAGAAVFIGCSMYFYFKYFKNKRKGEPVTDNNIQGIENAETEVSVSGKEFEIQNGLSREKISKKKFFAYAALGIAVSGVMWILNLLIGMGLIAL